LAVAPTCRRRAPARSSSNTAARVATSGTLTRQIHRSFTASRRCRRAPSLGALLPSTTNQLPLSRLFAAAPSYLLEGALRRSAVGIVYARSSAPRIRQNIEKASGVRHSLGPLPPSRLGVFGWSMRYCSPQLFHPAFPEPPAYVFQGLEMKLRPLVVRLLAVVAVAQALVWAQTPQGVKRDSRPSAEPTVTVYVTRTGEKYHRDDCRYLLRNKIAMQLDQAAARFSPCSVCLPPVPVVRTGNPSAPPAKVKSESSAPATPQTNRCQATTKKGTQCSRMAQAGRAFCWQH
jgi:hypothetical protein